MKHNQIFENLNNGNLLITFYLLFERLVLTI